MNWTIRQLKFLALLATIEMIPGVIWNHIRLAYVEIQTIYLKLLSAILEAYLANPEIKWR